MIIFAALCILIGVFPDYFYQFLPYQTDYVAYTAGKVLFYLQLLLFSGLAFFLLLPLMKRTLTISLDIDWFWRVALLHVGTALLRVIAAAGRALQSRVQAILQRLHAVVRRHLGGAEQKSQPGIFARAWPIGTTALWIAILLSAYVLAYYI